MQSYKYSVTFYAVLQTLCDHSFIVVQFYGKNTNLPIPVFAPFCCTPDSWAWLCKRPERNFAQSRDVQLLPHLAWQRELYQVHATGVLKTHGSRLLWNTFMVDSVTVSLFVFLYLIWQIVLSWDEQACLHLCGEAQTSRGGCEPLSGKGRKTFML